MAVRYRPRFPRSTSTPPRPIRPGRPFREEARQDSKRDGSAIRKPGQRPGPRLESCRAPLPGGPRRPRSDGRSGRTQGDRGATELQTGPRTGPMRSRETRAGHGRFAFATRKRANRKRFGVESKCPAWSLVASAEKSTGNADYPLESCRGSSGVLSRDSRFSTGVLSRKLLTESNNRTNSLSDKTPNCWH